MARQFLTLLVLASTALGAAPALARADFNQLAQHYAKAGGKDFSTERGKAFWQADHLGDNGEKMNCTTCHGSELGKPGKHNKSGKLIEPMAPSVNPERYSDLEKVEKWFTRNCKQVLRRECTAQEKGDVLRYLSQF
jgi:uncharacterized protein DUF1924